MGGDNSNYCGPEETASPVTPEITRDRRGDENATDQHDWEVIAILPLHYFVLPEIGDVRWTWLNSRVHKHPDDMRLMRVNDGFPKIATSFTHPPETSVSIVWVEICIGVPAVEF